MKRLFALALALSIGIGIGLVGNVGAQTVFRNYTSLTGNEVILDALNPAGASFKTSTLASYVDTTYSHAALVTVSALPTCNSASKGYFYIVTDANSPTYGGTLTGSSTTLAGAICDGTNWTAH